MRALTLPKMVEVPRFVGGGRIEFAPQPVAAPGPGQLLIACQATALCGSERGQFYHGSQVTPGHEIAGIVAAAGSHTHTAAGTPGVVFLMDFCGECHNCRQGYTNQCLARRANIGFDRDGGYGAYALISEHTFFPVDADLPLAEATLLLDIMGTGGHAIKRAQLVNADLRSVLILGAGPIGLAVLAMMRLLLGPEVPVVISDVVRYRLQLAERLGGCAVNVAEGSLQEGLRRYGIAAPEAAFDASGKAAVRQEALGLLATRGVFVCIAHGEGLPIENVSRDLIGRELAIVASEYFTYDELKANLVLLRQHRSYVNQIITHRLPVGDIQQAFELFFQSGQTGKVVIEQ